MQKQFSVGVALCLLVGLAHAADSSWVEKSNAHAQVVLAAFAELSPEGAASMGLTDWTRISRISARGSTNAA